MTYALRVTWSLAVHALAALIARVIALMALAALGLSGDPFHDRSTTEVLEQHEGRPVPAGEPGPDLAGRLGDQGSAGRLGDDGQVPRSIGLVAQTRRCATPSRPAVPVQRLSRCREWIRRLNGSLQRCW